VTTLGLAIFVHQATRAEVGVTHCTYGPRTILTVPLTGVAADFWTLAAERLPADESALIV
jgi:hypothetical protein